MKKIYSFLTAIALSTFAFAQQPHQQLSDGGEPWSFKFDQFDNQVPIETMPAIDVAGLMYEDSMTALQTKPYRFGFDHMVNFNLTNSGGFVTLDNGDKIWRLGIYAPDATSMSLSFQNMNLPEGCRLFVYDTRKGQWFGAFTQKHVTPEDKMLGTELVYTDHIIVELLIPQSALNNVSLEIWRVTQGYVDFGETIAKAFGNSGSCQNNARCPAYSAWDDQIRSGICLVNGGEFCSAALINNTCSDGTPYVLTANHCGSSGFGSWVFRFNWEATGCTNPGSSPSSNSISGSVSRANYAGADMRLLEMNSTPPANYNVYYAGWDRTNTTPTNMFGVHHPSGDIKKFSQSTGNGSTATYGSATCWQTGTWTDGVTEPGSSGSPIFNSSGLIVGQLYGGPSDCSCEGNAGCGYDYYGKVFTSWTGGGTNSTRLSNWLEPSGCLTGSGTQIGFDPNTPSVALDAAITIINVPADGASSCETNYTPEAVLRNYGSTTLTSVTLNYSLDGAPSSTQAWTGSLTTGSSTTVTLPAISVGVGAHTYLVATSNPNGSTDQNTANDSQTNSFTVTSAPVGTALPFTEGFDSNPFVPTGWTSGVTNQLNTNTWSRQATASGFGNSTAAARMDNFSGGTDITGQLNHITTPSLDFSTAIAPAFLDFSVAYAKYNAARNDSLIIYVSTDCGATYNRVFADGGTTLATAPNVTTAFVPSNTQWSARSVDMNAYVGEPSVYVRFESKSNWGNDLWIDDINLYYTGSTPPIADFSASPTTVCEGSTVTFTDLSTGSPATWSWSFPGGNPSVSTLQNPTVTYNTAGTYSVTLTATNGAGSDVMTQTNYITVNPSPVANAGSNSPVCEGQTINLSTTTVSGATYAWTGPSSFTSSSQNPNRPSATTAMSGSYQVTVTANGCSSVSSTNVTVNALPTANASSNSPVCVGQNISLATTTVAGATYAWTGPNSYSSSSQNPTITGATTAMAGSYQVMVTNNGCSNSSSVNVTVNANPTASGSASNASCNGNCDGTVTANATGGSGSYTYLWDDSSTQTTATATSLCSGSYNVVITDGNGCTANTSATVSEPTVLIITSVNTTQSACASSTGTATVNVTGGTPSYTYTLDAGTPQSLNSYSGLAAGTYVILVTDANGCSNQTTFSITNPNSPSATSSSLPTTCVGTCDGSGTVNITGGTAPYSVDWCGNNTQTGITSSTTYNALCAGTCNVTITDAAGCSTTQSVTITSPSAVSANMSATNALCNGDCNGQAIVTITGGTLPYTVDWCDASQSTNISSVATNNTLCASTCNVTVTDANGCTTTSSATVSEPTVLTTSETHVDEVNGNDGSINLTISGGTAPYSVSWDSGQNTEDLTGIAGGVYTATITDANGCTTQQVVTVGSTVGISENVLNDITIYPNPNSGIFTIDLGKNNSETTVVIYDVQGKLIYQNTFTADKNTIDLNLSTGMYNLRIKNADGMKNQKLMILK